VKLPAGKRMDAASMGGGNFLKPGMYLVILKDFVGPKADKKGHHYEVIFEEVCKVGKGGTARLWISCDTAGMPTMDFQGEAKWQLLKDACGIPPDADGDVDTNDLRWRSFIITIETSAKSKYPYITQIAPSNDGQEAAVFGYLARHYPT